MCGVFGVGGSRSEVNENKQPFIIDRIFVEREFMTDRNLY